MALTRAQTKQIDLWPLQLQDSLPTVPVPLNQPDGDVPLSLSEALAAIYEEAAYELSLNYSQPPPPPSLSKSDTQWMQERLSL